MIERGQDALGSWDVLVAGNRACTRTAGELKCVLWFSCTLPLVLAMPPPGLLIDTAQSVDPADSAEFSATDDANAPTAFSRLVRGRPRLVWPDPQTPHELLNAGKTAVCGT